MLRWVRRSSRSRQTPCSTRSMSRGDPWMATRRVLRSSAHPYALRSRGNLDEHLTVRTIRRSDKGETDVRHDRAFPPGHEAAAMAEEGAELLAALHSMVNGKGLNRACCLRPGAAVYLPCEPEMGERGGVCRYRDLRSYRGLGATAACIRHSGRARACVRCATTGARRFGRVA